MPAERMKFSYLEKMNLGFGKSYSRLIYNKILLYPGEFKLPARWYEWLAVNKTILQQSISILFYTDKQKVNRIKIKRAYNRGYAVQIINDWRQGKKMRNEIKRVFKSVKINLNGYN